MLNHHIRAWSQLEWLNDMGPEEYGIHVSHGTLELDERAAGIRVSE